MFNPAGLGQTIAVVDRSGKVVSTSRHLLNVFKEAKSAYREKKAEIVAAREAQANSARGLNFGRALTFNDGHSASSSHRSHRSHRSRRSSYGSHDHVAPSIRRRHTEALPGPHGATRELDLQGLDLASPPLPPRPHSTGGPHSARPSVTPRASKDRPKPLMRSHTTLEGQMMPMVPMSAPLVPRRSRSTDNIDMNLAYGEPPPNLMTAYRQDDVELRGLVGRVKGLLDEAHCVQHSVSSTMASLQKNPEAMAAVALTLAEISKLAKKMAPGALLKVRMLAPSVFALLTSPQFLIAAGVGVGVTVVALGGYKVIKKLQAQKEEEQSMDQMIALGSEVSSIENWRQGIADVEASSVGTSVDGEFITPTAARLSRLNLAETSTERTRSSEPSEPPRRTRTTRSIKSSASSRSSSSSKSEGGKERKKRKPKKEEKPKPSPLRNVFSF